MPARQKLRLKASSPIRVKPRSDRRPVKFAALENLAGYCQRCGDQDTTLPVVAPKAAKSQAPSTKSQTNSNDQGPNDPNGSRFDHSAFIEHSGLFGHCDLDIGHSSCAAERT
jgi:hypothetical protein